MFWRMIKNQSPVIIGLFGRNTTQRKISKEEKMTNKDMNYREQKLTCQFCDNFDLIRTVSGEAEFVCFLSKEPIDEAGICDKHEAGK